MISKTSRERMKKWKRENYHRNNARELSSLYMKKVN